VTAQNPGDFPHCPSDFDAISVVKSERTVKSVKPVSVIFSIGTCCGSICFNPNGRQAFYGFYVKITGDTHTPGGGGKF
jgi:hypothetical protein